MESVNAAIIFGFATRAYPALRTNYKKKPGIEGFFVCDAGYSRVVYKAKML